MRSDVSPGMDCQSIHNILLCVAISIHLSLSVKGTGCPSIFGASRGTSFDCRKWKYVIFNACFVFRSTQLIHGFMDCSGVLLPFH